MELQDFQAVKLTLTKLLLAQADSAKQGPRQAAVLALARLQEMGSSSTGQKRGCLTRVEGDAEGGCGSQSCG